MQDNLSSENTIPLASSPHPVFTPSTSQNPGWPEPLPPINKLATRASDPKLDLPKKEVSIALLSHIDEAECEFWIGLAKKGPHHPNLLLDLGNVNEIFTKAAAEGIAENGAVMLSDAQNPEARYLYLVPSPFSDGTHSDGSHASGTEPPDRAWTDRLAQTVAAWAPNRVGLYVAAELVAGPACHQLIKSILLSMIPKAPCAQYYLLVGGHGLNAMLNTALTLRMELLNHAVQLSVFHP